MYVRERQDLASDQAQSREMHDAWCARPENDGTGFCEGLREWKAGQGRGDRDELSPLAPPPPPSYPLGQTADVPLTAAWRNVLQGAEVADDALRQRLRASGVGGIEDDGQRFRVASWQFQVDQPVLVVAAFIGGFLVLCLSVGLAYSCLIYRVRSGQPKGLSHVRMREEDGFRTPSPPREAGAKDDPPKAQPHGEHGVPARTAPLSPYPVSKSNKMLGREAGAKADPPKARPYGERRVPTRTAPYPVSTSDKAFFI